MRFLPAWLYGLGHKGSQIIFIPCRANRNQSESAPDLRGERHAIAANDFDRS
jgi:hypothetical protein